MFHSVGTVASRTLRNSYRIPAAQRNSKSKYGNSGSVARHSALQPGQGAVATVQSLGASLIHTVAGRLVVTARYACLPDACPEWHSWHSLSSHSLSQSPKGGALRLPAATERCGRRCAAVLVLRYRRDPRAKCERYNRLTQGHTRATIVSQAFSSMPTIPPRQNSCRPYRI